MALLMVMAVFSALCLMLDMAFGTKLFYRPTRHYGAKATFGAGVTGIVGSIGDTVFQRWKSGVTSIRKKATCTHNPHSLVQSSVRAGLSSASKFWTTVLSVAERTGWNEYALTKPFSGPNTGGVNELIKHNNGIFSGLNAYIATNQALVRVGIAPVTAAPLAAVPPSPPLAVAVSCVAGTATVTWTTPLTAKAGALVRLWCRVEGAGRIHPQIVAAPAYDADTGAITSVRAANGEVILLSALVGARLWVQADTIDTDGTRSMSSNVASVIIA